MDWIYGIHAVQTMLKSAPGSKGGVRCRCSAGGETTALQKIHKLAEQHGMWPCSRATVKAGWMRRAEGRHQGVMALCSPGETHDENYLLLKLAEEKGGEAFFLMLDGVTDPHNLGACSAHGGWCRCAWGDCAQG